MPEKNIEKVDNSQYRPKTSLENYISIDILRKITLQKYRLEIHENVCIQLYCMYILISVVAVLLHTVKASGKYERICRMLNIEN